MTRRNQRVPHDQTCTFWVAQPVAPSIVLLIAALFKHALLGILVGEYPLVTNLGRLAWERPMVADLGR